MIEINGIKVTRGDLIVLMVSPDPGSQVTPTNTFCLVTLDDVRNVDMILQVHWMVLQELITEDERRAMYDAIFERRIAMEGSNETGIYAMIWSREAYQQKLRENSPAPPPVFIDAADLLQAMQVGMTGTGARSHIAGTVDMTLAAAVLGDLVTRRALKL